MEKLLILILLAVSIFLHVIWNCEAVSFEEDTTLSKQQGLALKKFKERMLPLMEKDFMKEDLYLIRWLRARNFDVVRAEEFLKTHLKWRRENSMDTIHEEDWSDLKDFHYALPGQDREGRVVLQWDLGDWDIRNAVVAGKLKRLVRYTNKMWEEARIKVYDLGLQGKNVTRWTMIVDMANINAVQHINAGGIPFFLTAAASYDTNFPGMGDTIFLLNTPGIFEAVLGIIRPTLAPHTRKALQVYGKGQDKWRPDVVAAIDPAILPKHYGGTQK